jgi:hypothetical protein
MASSSPTLGISNSYVASTLRKVFQVFRISDALVACTNVKFSFNKVKGRLGFLPENQVPLGGYYGGYSPQKMVPFFAKNSLQMR